MKVRASTWTMGDLCAGNVALMAIAPEQAVDETLAANGTIAHDYAARMAMGERFDLDAEENADVQEVVGKTLALWHKGSPDHGLLPIKEYLDGYDIAVEREVSDDYGSGHPDIDGWNEATGNLFVLDWKTGYREDDATAQLVRYAHLVAQHRGVVPESVTLMVVFPRQWEWQATTMEWPEVVSRVEKVRRNIVLAEKWLASEDKRDLSCFTEGPHCHRCRVSHRCPAMNHAITLFKGLDVGDLPNPDELCLEGMPEDDVARAFHVAKRLEDYGKRIRAEVRARVASGGAIPVDEKTAIGLKPKSNTVIPDSLKMLQFLRTVMTDGGDPVFDDDALAKVIAFRTTPLWDIVKAIAPRGQKGAALAEMKELLESKGILVQEDAEPTLSVYKRETLGLD